MQDPKRRFSGAVVHYDRYRPSYPEDLVRVLEGKRLLGPRAVVADVGSGTGILSALFLRRGYRVIGVEPNPDMRRAAERRLGGEDAFRSVDGSAEATGLEPASVDLVVAGQAFHWFDPLAAREEFRRILRGAGAVALVWNDRRTRASAFHSEYEALLERHGADYRPVGRAARGRDRLGVFFGGDFEIAELDNSQLLDRDGLKGRVLSCSYVPHEGQPGYEELLRACDALFERHRDHERVVLEYRTRLYYGRLS